MTRFNLIRLCTISVLFCTFNIDVAYNQQFTGAGTTRGIKDIFLGRCAEVTNGLVNPQLSKDELRNKNCTTLWHLFHDAFAYKQPCNVTSDMFETFVEAASVSTPLDKAVFWDGWGIFNTVRAYVDEARRATSLEFVLVGYLINQLTFCGQEEHPGINYELCPDWGQCGFGAGPMDGFWKAASLHFGSQATGNVRVILNSNRPGGSYQPEESYFANFEVPNLNSSKVTKMDIYVVTLLNEEPGDTCQTGSISLLMQTLSEKGITYECFDQPKDVLHLLCADNINLEKCALGMSSANKLTSNVATLNVILVGLTLQYFGLNTT